MARYRTVAMVTALPAIAFLIQTFGIADFLNLSEWIQAIAVGNIISFGSLLAFWGVFGGRPLPWRMVAMFSIMALILCSSWEELTTPETFFAYEVMVITGLLLIEGFLFALLRWIGVELAFGEDRRKDWHRGRYSLGYLFHWMAAVAVLSSALAWTPWREIFRWVDPLWVFFIFGTMEGVPALLLTLTILGRRHRWFLRVGITLIFLATTPVIISVLDPSGSGTPKKIALCFGLIAVTIIFWHLLVLYPLWWIGYRFVWRARREF